MREDGRDVEVHDAPAVAPANPHQGIGQFLFDDVFAHGIELELRAADVDEPGRFEGGEPHDVADDVARQPRGRREQ